MPPAASPVPAAASAAAHAAEDGAGRLARVIPAQPAPAWGGAGLPDERLRQVELAREAELARPPARGSQPGSAGERLWEGDDRHGGGYGGPAPDRRPRGPNPHYWEEHHVRGHRFGDQDVRSGQFEDAPPHPRGHTYYDRPPPREQRYGGAPAAAAACWNAVAVQLPPTCSCPCDASCGVGGCLAPAAAGSVLSRHPRSQWPAAVAAAAGPGLMCACPSCHEQATRTATVRHPRAAAMASAGHIPASGSACPRRRCETASMRSASATLTHSTVGGSTMARHTGGAEGGCGCRRHRCLPSLLVQPPFCMLLPV